MKPQSTPNNTPTVAATTLGKVIIFSAPSGSGKSTIINYLMAQGLNLHFSVSATSRPPRGTEKDGVEYYFITPQDFRDRIERGDFLEYQEVYAGRFYGTLKAEVDRLLAAGQNVVCDVDVLGAENIKRIYRSQALSLFIQPPSIEALRDRLYKRGTDSAEVIADRLARAAFELTHATAADVVIVNDQLATAQAEALACVKKFLAS